VSAFQTLQHHYAHRLDEARSAHAEHMKVVGLIGNTIPRELVLAAGMFPVLISATFGQPTPTADRYMEDVIPPETKLLFEVAASGELEFMDLLVVSRPYAHLYYYLKEVYRLGRAPDLPPLHIFDLIHAQRDVFRAYNLRELAAFAERLERLSGCELTEPRLRAAIETTNRVRALQRELLQRRWLGMLSGIDALQVLGAGYFMAPERYAETLQAYLSTLQASPELAQKPRLVVVSSEPLSDLRVHEALESAGGLVVAEDDWWGARAPGSHIATDVPPRQAVFEKYWRDTATSDVTPGTAREAWFRTHAIRDDVDGVVFHLPASDRQLGWDYPRLKAFLDKHQKPSIRLRSQPGAVGDWLAGMQGAGVLP
jgi:benzoyl-CoA reductase/2-hydroxyglutaryl-CoA dehydratase subunit BcrC/BadD/HgdB